MPSYFSRPVFLSAVSTPDLGSITFVSNAVGNYERGRIVTLPTNFGAAEFSLSFWLKPTSGTTSDFADDTPEQRNDWTTRNTAAYANSTWWFRGNFCMDVHNNNSFSDGTLSLQFTNTCRPRWTFGDGAAAAARTGSLHAAQNGSASLRDDGWHKIAFVRRFDGGTGSILESWVDGVMAASETSTARTNMWTTYWQNWTGYPAAQTGFWFGTEKQAALGVINQWEDYKGLLSELCFYSKALSTAELQSLAAVQNTADGLMEIIRFTEGSGTTATGINGTVMTLTNSPAWNSVGPFG